MAQTKTIARKSAVDVHQAVQYVHEGDVDPEDMANVVMERKPTRLPKVQLSVLLYLQLAEPITAQVILPFIAQVSMQWA
jgi:hypothetical protein